MPSRSYTLTRVTSGEQDLVWDDASGAYVKYVPPVAKPEQLYAYSKESIDMYAWTVLDTDTINPITYKTIYTPTPTIETGMQTTMDNAYVLVDGELVNVSLSDIISINGTGGELYVTASNNEYIEMKLTGPI